MSFESITLFILEYQNMYERWFETFKNGDFSLFGGPSLLSKYLVFTNRK